MIRYWHLLPILSLSASLAVGWALAGGGLSNHAIGIALGLGVGLPFGATQWQLGRLCDRRRDPRQRPGNRAILAEQAIVIGWVTLTSVVRLQET